MHTVYKYLDRIRYTGSLTPTAETLRALNRAQMLTVPYETIDIRLGIRPSLAHDVVYSKIVTHHRGGWCYELNSLFGWLLRQLGFDVTFLSARILSLYQEGKSGPEFEHLVLLVQLDQPWLVDVGHGEVFDYPLPLVSGIEVTEITADIRLKQQGELWFLSRRINELEWAPMYMFTLKPRSLRDFNDQIEWINQTKCNWYKNNTLVIRSTTNGKIALCTDRLSVWEGRQCSKSTVPKSEYLKTLKDTFDVKLPSHTNLDALLAPDYWKGTDYGLSTHPSFDSIG